MAKRGWLQISKDILIILITYIPRVLGALSQELGTIPKCLSFMLQRVWLFLLIFNSFIAVHYHNLFKHLLLRDAAGVCLSLLLLTVVHLNTHH